MNKEELYHVTAQTLRWYINIDKFHLDAEKDILIIDNVNKIFEFINDIYEELEED